MQRIVMAVLSGLALSGAVRAMLDAIELSVREIFRDSSRFQPAGADATSATA